ncbi:hypothetical protein ACFL96_14070 [Thermoproteota archaeon]
MMDIKLVQGNKSENDKKVLVTCFEHPISFCEVAKIIVLLSKNEQVLSSEKSYYTAGSQQVKKFFDYICDTDWLKIPDENIDAELGALYRQSQEDYHKQFATEGLQ